MSCIKIGTICTYPLIGLCRVNGYDTDARAVVEYKMKRYKTHTTTASIAPHLLRVVNSGI